VTAADKLRELLATRPALPNYVELVRWWLESAKLIPEALNELEARARDVAEPMVRPHGDPNRCPVCGFRLFELPEYGCVPGNCSMRRSRG
jgi:hypothetical protein